MNPANAAPELPLRDILVPAPPPWWPPAPGWWLLAALLLGLLAWAGLIASQRLRQRRRQRRILAKLDRLAASHPPAPVLIAGVSALLKRAALARWPREQVAPLTGPAWLAWLDHTGGGDAFRRGPGRVLADGPYAPATAGVDTVALLAVARDWLTRNT